jgi:hypothetical protein
MFSPTTYFFLKKEAKKRNIERKEEKEAEWDTSGYYRLVGIQMVVLIKEEMMSFIKISRMTHIPAIVIAVF